MIISLLGTNGAGKSHLVRRIMSFYPVSRKLEYPGRQKPAGYILTHNNINEKHLYVPGHYEIANGGLDTLPSLPMAYELMRIHALELGCNVLYEGKNFTDKPQNLLDLRDAGLPIAVALIDEPLEDCVKAVRERGHKIQEKTIEALHRKSRRHYYDFQEEKVECFLGSREQVFAKVFRWLNLV